MNVKEVKPQLKMYGYALDMVNYDKDKNGFKLSEDNVIPYYSVVNDTSVENRDPYTAWGNKSSTEDLFKQYVEWVTSVKKNLYADVTLKIAGKNSEKEYNNFNVSMSSLVDKHESTKHRETTQYPIYIRRGAIDTEGLGYQALLNQIKTDYQCSEEEAKALFEESDMYQTILKAVEDTKDAFNKSQKVNTEDGGTHAVRTEDTEDNWYDEEVKTFVIRRYESDPVEFKNIVLTDKIDYGLTPDSTAGRDNKNSAQQKSYNSYEGKWYLTLYFKNDTKKESNLYLSEEQRYQPNKGRVQTNTDYFKGGTVLIHNLYVSGADFKIPSATTNDMLR